MEDRGRREAPRWETFITLIETQCNNSGVYFPFFLAMETLQINNNITLFTCNIPFKSFFAWRKSTEDFFGSFSSYCD